LKATERPLAYQYGILNHRTKERVNQSARSEVNMSTEAEASLISSTVLSVVRDRSISSAYGLFLKMLAEEGVGGAPPLDAIFSDKMANCMRANIVSNLGSGALALPLYSGEGDLLGQLARLLVVCNERLAHENAELIERADAAIGALGIEAMARNGEYVKHLRNAVLHGHFEAIRNEEDPFETIIHFWDVNMRKREGRKTGDYRLTISDLNSIIDILINDVCLKYLKHIGWELESAYASES